MIYANRFRTIDAADGTVIVKEVHEATGYRKEAEASTLPVFGFTVDNTQGSEVVTVRFESTIEASNTTYTVQPGDIRAFDAQFDGEISQQVTIEIPSGTVPVILTEVLFPIKKRLV